MRAIYRGTTNTFRAVPIGKESRSHYYSRDLVGYSVYDYIKNLKGLPYPSEEYVKMREEVWPFNPNRDLGK